MRAWYLPTCVNGAMPVTSPIAQTFSAARMRSSTSIPRREISSPSGSRPSTFGLRPVATSSRSNASSRPVGEERGCSPSTRSARGAEPDVDAVLPQRLLDERGRVRVDTREQPRVALHERHLRADALEELRELAADRAAAEHDEARRHLERLRRLDVRPVVDRVEPLDRRDRPATSRSRSRAGRSAAPSSPTARTPGSGTTASPRTSSAFIDVEPLDLRRVVALGDLVAPREDPLRVERRAGRSRRPSDGGGRDSSGARSIVFVGMHAQ